MGSLAALVLAALAAWFLATRRGEPQVAAGAGVIDAEPAQAPEAEPAPPAVTSSADQ
jgi:hypothetical protein